MWLKHWCPLMTPLLWLLRNFVELANELLQTWSISENPACSGCGSSSPASRRWRFFSPKGGRLPWARFTGKQAADQRPPAPSTSLIGETSQLRFLLRRRPLPVNKLQSYSILYGWMKDYCLESCEIYIYFLKSTDSRKRPKHTGMRYCQRSWSLLCGIELHCWPKTIKNTSMRHTVSPGDMFHHDHVPEQMRCMLLF